MKALTAEAEAAEEAARKAREELQALSQQHVGSSHLEAALEAEQAAVRAHALARCRRLQVKTLGARCFTLDDEVTT